MAEFSKKEKFYYCCYRKILDELKRLEKELAQVCEFLPEKSFYGREVHEYFRSLHVTIGKLRDNYPSQERKAAIQGGEDKIIQSTQEFIVARLMPIQHKIWVFINNGIKDLETRLPGARIIDAAKTKEPEVKKPRQATDPAALEKQKRILQIMDEINACAGSAAYIPKVFFDHEELVDEVTAKAEASNYSDQSLKAEWNLVNLIVNAAKVPYLVDNMLPELRRQMTAREEPRIASAAR